MRPVPLALALVVVASACAAEPSRIELNHPYETPPPVASSAPVADAGPAWTHFAELAAWPKANARRFVSAGHFLGRYEADVRSNAIASSFYASLAPGSSLPVGAIVAKVHYLPSSEQQGPTLAMEKGASSWRFVEIDPAGHVVREGEGLHPCVDCHDHVASQDHLFGVPTSGR